MINGMVMKIEKEKKSAAEVILSLLQNKAQLSIDLATLFFRTRYKGVRLMKYSPVIPGDWARMYRERKIFNTRLGELKKEGFVEMQENSRGSFLAITKKGRKQLLKEKRRTRGDYKKKQSGTTTIISYDIPETKSRERRWLRGILEFLDFVMIHKSVWVGTTLLPEELFRDMRAREIFEHVHIFEVGKRGTIKKSIERK